MTAKRKSKPAPPEPPSRPLSLDELADEVSAAADDLVYSLAGLSSAGVPVPPDFTATAESILKRALGEIAALVDSADRLIPRAAPAKPAGTAQGRRPLEGTLASQRG